MKTKIIISIATILLMVSSITFGQLVNYSSTAKEITNLNQSSTLYVIKVGNAELDEQLEKSVRTHWKLTQIGVIEEKELEKYLGNENNYFIAPLKLSFSMKSQDISLYIGDYKEVASKHMGIFWGDKKKLSKYTSFSTVAWMPLPNIQYNIYVNYIDFMVKGITNALQLSIDNKLKKHDPALQNLINSSSAKKIKDKTLYYESGEDYFLSQKLLKKYKFKYELKSFFDIAEMFKTKTPGSCYMYYSCCDPPWQIYVIDIETNDVLYFFAETGMRGGMKFTEKDIEKLNKTIQTGK